MLTSCRSRSFSPDVLTAEPPKPAPTSSLAGCLRHQARFRNSPNRRDPTAARKVRWTVGR